MFGCRVRHDYEARGHAVAVRLRAKEADMKSRVTSIVLVSSALSAVVLWFAVHRSEPVAPTPTPAGSYTTRAQ